MAQGSTAPNTIGLRRVMFTVDDIARYEDSHRLCYVSGPGGIIVSLAWELG